LLPLPPQSRLKKAVEDFVSDSFAAILRRDYLDLINSLAAEVEGKTQRCAATLITYYRHWQEWKQEHQRTDWLYQPLRQIYKDLMKLFSMPTIRAANDLLIDLGLLERRSNPGNRQDKTYQYNVRFDRITQLLTQTRATSSFEKTDVSAAISNFSASLVDTHHKIQSTQVRSSNRKPIEKEELNSTQESSASIIQVEILTKTKEEEEVRRLIAESWGEATRPAASSLDSDEMMQAASSDNSAAMNVASEFLGNLNAEAELQKRSRFDRIPRPLCIPGLDESAHEILWKYQAQLEKLNVDLNTERIKSAIADNPQHLEDAILALIENSAKGAKTSVAATGFLLNALRQGWKPRQSSSRDSASVPVYALHPLMLEEPKPSTLFELVERKRLMWKTAILRPSIAAWAEATPGVVLTDSGPELEQQVETPTSEPQSIDEKDLTPRQATNAAYPTNLNQTDPVVASDRTAPLAAVTPAESPQLDPNSPLEVEPSIDLRGSPPLQEVNSVDPPVASERTLLAGTTAHTARVEPPLKQSPKQQLQAKPKQQWQPVEILTSAGEWVSGYFVHCCIAVANLTGLEQRFQLFDVLGAAYIFFGQIRPAEALSSVNETA